MDIEGAEDSVFTAPDALAWMHNTTMVAVELHWQRTAQRTQQAGQQEPLPQPVQGATHQHNSTGGSGLPTLGNTTASGLTGAARTTTGPTNSTSRWGYDPNDNDNYEDYEEPSEDDRPSHPLDDVVFKLLNAGHMRQFRTLYHGHFNIYMRHL